MKSRDQREKSSLSTVKARKFNIFRFSREREREIREMYTANEQLLNLLATFNNKLLSIIRLRYFNNFIIALKKISIVYI